MTLHPKQKEVVRSKARFKVLNCGRGWGKTHLAVELLLWNALNKKDAKVAYIAPTFQQARDIAWQRVIKRTQDIAIKTNESRLELTVPNKYKGESTLVLRGWEAIETLRGQEFDFIVIDEVASMRDFWVGWEEVLRPTLRVSQGGVLFISTPRGFNHFYDLFNTQHENWQSFHYTSYDNPFLPVAEIEEARRQLPEDSFAQEYMADFRKMEGLVYKEFIRDVHIYKDEVEQTEAYLGAIDFGFTNPCAVLHVYRDYDGAYWVDNEFYKTQQTEEHIAEYVANCKFNATFPDPENPSAIEVLRKKGVNCREVIKNKDSVVSGIQKIRELFKQNRLFIHERCVNLISELETYAYDPDKNDEKPVKEHDHALDALRYLISTDNPEPKVSLQELRRRAERRLYTPANHAR